MRLKVALAGACLAAALLPAAPAAAAEGIPGTCYETTIGGSGGTRSYPCECLIGLPWVTVSPPPPTFTITYCHVYIPLLDGDAI